MLASLDEYLRAKKSAILTGSFSVIVDKEILQSDWTRVTPGHAQLKIKASDPTSLNSYL